MISNFTKGLESLEKTELGKRPLFRFSSEKSQQMQGL